MPSILDVKDALRARLDALDIKQRWHGDDDNGPLPDKPEDFAYMVFDNFGSRPGPVAFGGGLGNNIYRSTAILTAIVFVPNHAGMRHAEEEGETIAALMRSYRDAVIFCKSADVKDVGDGASIAPPGLQRNELNNYLCAIVEVDVSFDQTG